MSSRKYVGYHILVGRKRNPSYVGITRQTLPERLRKHRTEGNVYVRALFDGEKPVRIKPVFETEDYERAVEWERGEIIRWGRQHNNTGILANINRRQ